MTVRITGQCRPDRGTIDKSSAGRDYRMSTFENDIEPVVSVQNRRWGALDDTHDEDFLGRGQVKSYDGISAIEPGFGNARVNRRRTLETGSWTWTSSRNHGCGWGTNLGDYALRKAACSHQSSSASTFIRFT